MKRILKLSIYKEKKWAMKEKDRLEHHRRIGGKICYCQYLLIKGGVSDIITQKLDKLIDRQGGMRYGN